jgi:hypothetical protein
LELLKIYIIVSLKGTDDLKDGMLDIEEIKKIIPHRYPFLFVDRILELEEGKKSSWN